MIEVGQLVRGLGVVLMTVTLGGCLSSQWEVNNKPGVSREAYLADINDCADEATGRRPRDPAVVPPPNTVAASAATGAMSGAIGGASKVLARHAYVKDCMQSKGYQRVRLTKEQTDAVKAYEAQHGRNEALAQIAGEPL